jgi:hypothetical protein
MSVIEHTDTTEPVGDGELIGHHGLFSLVHRSLEADLAKLETAVDDLTLADRVERGRKMDHWFRGYAKVVRHHHRIEHELFWSALVAEAGPQPALAQLAEDFAVLDAALEAVRAGFWRFRHAREFVVPQYELVQQIQQARAALRTYVAHEEASLVEPFRARFVNGEFPKVDPRITAGLGLRGAAFAVPWALGGLTDDERRELLPQVPAPLRLLYRACQFTYQRKAAALNLWSPKSLRYEPLGA